MSKHEIQNGNNEVSITPLRLPTEGSLAVMSAKVSASDNRIKGSD